MARPVTRAKNANQHPGKVVLDMMQKHHTSEQKRQDEAREYYREQRASGTAPTMEKSLKKRK